MDAAGLDAAGLDAPWLGEPAGRPPTCAVGHMKPAMLGLEPPPDPEPVPLPAAGGAAAAEDAAPAVLELAGTAAEDTGLRAAFGEESGPEGTGMRDESGPEGTGTRDERGPEGTGTREETGLREDAELGTTARLDETWVAEAAGAEDATGLPAPPCFSNHFKPPISQYESANA